MVQPKEDPLEEALARLGATDPVPNRVDDAIRRAAAERLRPARPAWRPRLVLGGLAAAAALALFVWFGGPGGPGARDERLARGDVDADGRVDILDAWRLARLLRDGDETRDGWDLSGDGVVDAADVDAVAALAVRLDR